MPETRLLQKWPILLGFKWLDEAVPEIFPVPPPGLLEKSLAGAESEPDEARR